MIYRVQCMAWCDNRETAWTESATVEVPGPHDLSRKSQAERIAVARIVRRLEAELREDPSETFTGVEARWTSWNVKAAQA